MSAPTKQVANAPDRFKQRTAAQPTVQLTKANPESVVVPIGVLEVPIGVWGSRRVESNSAEAARVELFAEETCTVIVFPQGAVIRLSASVATGQLIMIANRKSGHIMLCRVVNVRTYPNIRGYAEIEFMHSAKSFWGSYATQGTLRLPARMASAVPSTTSADFWTNGFSSAPPNAVAASPAASPVRAKKELIDNPAIQISFAEEPVQRVATIGPDSESRIDRTSSLDSARFRIRAFLFGWWRRPIIRIAANRPPALRRRLVLVSVMSALILVLGVFGVTLLHDGMEQPSGISQTNPMPEVSLGSPVANVVQSPQPRSKTSSVVPVLPIAKSENFPGTQRREFADNIRFSRPSERKATSERKITNGRLLAPHSTANRLAAMGRDAPPDVIGVDSNASASVLQGVLATLQPHGGRAKEPELLSSSPPIYPALAKQAHIEGQVTIDAVIDTTGKLTNMTVVSGAPLLQQAALDSLRTWKYQPGYLNEKPVPTKTSITVNFHLR